MWPNSHLSSAGFAATNHAMIDVLRRNMAMVVGVAATGVLGAIAAPAMVRASGAPGPGLLYAESPAWAFAAVLGVFIVMTIIAGLAGKLSNAAVGLFVLGAGVFVLARRGGGVQELVFGGTGGGGWPGLLMIETLLWAVMILGAAMAVFSPWLAGPFRDVEPDSSGAVPDALLSREALLCAGAGAVMLPVVWIVAQSPMKGQALAAAILGGLGAGLVGRLLSPHVQPVLLFASACAFGALGHALGLMATPGELEMAVVGRATSSLNRVMPIDYAAGALLGVSMGLGWARSFLHHEH
jgi:hypothetical protein